MNSCIMKQQGKQERMTRKKDICTTCFKRPLCPIRMKGDFHLEKCSTYLKGDGAI